MSGPKQMSLDHMGINVPKDKHEEKIAWLLKTLAPIGFKEHMRYGPAVGMGIDVPDFWVTGVDSGEHKNMHIAFAAKTHKQVDKCYAAAIEAGAKCNGKPGPRPQYHEFYYGAFVHDPVSGNNYEIVNHHECPEAKKKEEEEEGA